MTYERNFSKRVPRLKIIFEIKSLIKYKMVRDSHHTSLKGKKQMDQERPMKLFITFITNFGQDKDKG